MKLAEKILHEIVSEYTDGVSAHFAMEELDRRYEKLTGKKLE